MKSKKPQIATNIFWLVTVAVAAIGLGSFTLSFLALQDVAINNGVNPTLGWIWPLIVDVSMVIYTVSILVSQLQRRGAKLPIALTIFYSVVTVAGNLLHAPPTPTGWFVAALPPISLILGAEMLRVMSRYIIERQNRLDDLAELDQQIQQAGRELATVTGKLERAAAQLDQVKQSNLGNLADANNTRQAKKEQAMANLLTYLDQNPHASQVEAGHAIGRSKSTVGNYITELSEAGQLEARNGHGWCVVK